MYFTDFQAVGSIGLMLVNLLGSGWKVRALKRGEREREREIDEGEERKG